MAIIIDGRMAAEGILQDLKRDISELSARTGIKPKLSAILVGDDPSSAVYIRMKEKACAGTGIESDIIRKTASITEKELLRIMEDLNSDQSVHGIIVQLPLPKHIDEKNIIAAIDPAKDVDGFHPLNMGKLITNGRGFEPCTPTGIMELLHRYKIPIEGKHAVVVGRSNIVGKPASVMLLKENATVTICHSRTKNLGAITRLADILVVAVGKPRLITEDMVKDGAVVIDVGVNRLPDRSLCGDVDFENVSKKTYAITPVPGGVGPMTVAMLMKNTFHAYKMVVG